jgi:hypothetical protein
LQRGPADDRFPAFVKSRERSALVDFLEEVDEQLRSERYVNALKRLAPWITGLLALALLGYLGYWGYKTYQEWEITKAALAYEDGLAALEKNDAAAARAAFQSAGQSGAAGYKTLALMQLGNLSAADNKPQDAAKSYDAAAAAAPNPIFGDLARLKAAEVLLDTAPLAQIQIRLQPLTKAKRPYAAQAKEALALAELKAGRFADARRDFFSLMLSIDTPQAVRQRSQAAVELIDQGAGPAAVAGVNAVPTPPAAAPNVVPQGAPGQAGSAPAQSSAAPGAAQ